MVSTVNREKRYKPVEGCEQCEFYETDSGFINSACIECIMYGEAEEIEDGQAEADDD